MDSLELWNEFRRGEQTPAKRTRLVICQLCESRPSNPAYDGDSDWVEADWLPDPLDVNVYQCDQCHEAEEIAWEKMIAQTAPVS